MTHTQGIHHLGLTVSDVKAASTFFIEALGFKQVKEVSAYPAIFVSDGTIMLTLWQAEDPATATPFDRKANLGLHHFALRVAETTVLAELHEQLVARDDVTIEFAPEALDDSGIEHMMCRIPGNIRLELIKL
ncbi:VOC family protein [Marinomonas colpomeniae]|uniref:VOC family protein n=1 Tax=Marinomonas colpomeniae TaxID=2774408 RepID=A0ABR8NX52_9GAMM|nr:VOC family protein [Marinomonas colpomeniae]MBD5770616.1 VOC family protein [Marinomonas colpomeniae]